MSTEYLDATPVGSDDGRFYLGVVRLHNARTGLKRSEEQV